MTLNLFKTFTLTWWQAAFFKIGMLTLGIAIGTSWPGLFSGYLPILLTVAVITLATVSYAWLKQ